MGDFKKLRVWQLSCELADDVEKMAHGLPNSMRARVFDQLVRAAHSIHENIAEGSGFDSDRQLSKYLGQALSSANETEDELLEIDRKGLLGEFGGLPRVARSVCAMLAVFKEKVDGSIAAEGRRNPRPSRKARRKPKADS